MEKPTATQYKVNQIIKNLDLSTDPIDVRLRIQLHGETLATQEQVLALWIAYENWIYTQSDLMHHYENNTEIAGGYLLNEWVNFLARNGENLYRAFTALNEEYNPLDNYSLDEEIVNIKRKDNEKKTETPAGKIINTVTQSGTETTVNTLEKYGLDSVNGNPADKNTQTYTPNNRTQTTETTYGAGTKTETETEYDNTKSETFDNTELAGYNETEKHLLKRKGNVGVTSPVQMLTGEIEIRKTDLIRDFVKRFFHEYCYFVG